MLRFVLLTLLLPFLTHCQTPALPYDETRELTPENFRVAYVGDLGASEYTQKVLQMIPKEKAELFVLLGDFDYVDDPVLFERMLTENVPTTPLIAVAGNHDVKAWKGYKPILERRLQAIPDIRCVGELGVQQHCTYRGISFVLSGVGVFGYQHEQFISKALQNKAAYFKVCAWHKNQSAMQAGNKRDETGWEVYQACRDGGAMIATAHEHSYSRTYLLSDFEKQTVVNQSSELVLDKGQTFAFVSGLGGKSIREQKRVSWVKKAAGMLNKDPLVKQTDPWWAKVYTMDQKANHSVLFCDYHVDGDPRKARCFLKNIDDQIIDEFTIISKV